MQAAYLHENCIRVGDLPDPVPQKGQVLVRTRRCGVCASDAHFLSSGPTIVAESREYGGPYASVDLSQRIVMGHEFVGEILDYGPGSRRPLEPGTKVTSAPIMRHGPARGIIGYVGALPGGFGEYMLLDEDHLLAVPGGLDDDLAALIEPLAVGLEHARSGEPQPGEIPLVIGCGAIGLGVIAGLKLRGIAPIVAADLNERRRQLALRMGADVVVDPREISPYAPLPSLGSRRPNLVYECVGKPGLLNQIIHGVGFGARIVMGGFCLQPEQLYVPSAQSKRLKINFACGEEQQDMELALRSIADGKIRRVARGMRRPECSEQRPDANVRSRRASAHRRGSHTAVTNVQPGWVAGSLCGLSFPAHAQALCDGGAEFLTAAFRASGALTGTQRVASIEQFDRPELVALCHWNANVDNAWYYPGAHAELECGLMDWGHVSQTNLAMSLWGCLSAAETELWDRHLDELLQLMCTVLHLWRTLDFPGALDEFLARERSP